ncbi:MAG: transposase, partial [Cytophagaceae bacterium]
AIDCFSRFVEAAATENVQGATCAGFLEQIICRFGVPRVVLSDNAPSFCNQHMKALQTSYLFEHRNSTPHHHEGNAVVERAIQTIQQKSVAFL